MPVPGGIAKSAASDGIGPADAACACKSQSAGTRACQMPLRSGLPSAVRAGGCAAAVQQPAHSAKATMMEDLKLYSILKILLPTRAGQLFARQLYTLDIH